MRCHYALLANNIAAITECDQDSGSIGVEILEEISGKIGFSFSSPLNNVFNERQYPNAPALHNAASPCGCRFLQTCLMILAQLCSQYTCDVSLLYKHFCKARRVTSRIRAISTNKKQTTGRLLHFKSRIMHFKASPVHALPTTSHPPESPLSNHRSHPDHRPSPRCAEIIPLPAPYHTWRPAS